ncbi:TetR family transcriptional regulator [Streptomyces flaveolus]|uniref:TetR family transcriptional regulator n=1 Tax=Streptomyces flaveolus TaxID=67297 RepID=UPI0033A705D6
MSATEERRETVPRTAIDTFAARGYWGTTVTEAAKAAGVSRAYAHRLFRGKELRFTAVVE